MPKIQFLTAAPTGFFTEFSYTRPIFTISGKYPSAQAHTKLLKIVMPVFPLTKNRKTREQCRKSHEHSTKNPVTLPKKPVTKLG